MTLKEYLNKEIKKKGISLTEAKKDAGKYKSIAAAKKAGSLFYTKDGKVMAAVYAEDLKKKPITRPKTRPKDLEEEPATKGITQSEIKVSILPDLDPEAQKIVDIAERALTAEEEANLKKSLGKDLADLTKERRKQDRAGKSKGGSIDHRKTGMFYKTGSPRGYR